MTLSHPLIVIAATAHASAHYFAEIQKFGFDDLLVKPLNKKYVLDCLTRHFDFDEEVNS